MAKLLVAFVHHDDATPVADALNAAGHRFTQLPSVGGFLGTENATIVLGAEEEAADDVIAIFERVCSRREVAVPLVLFDRLADWQAKTVAFGGATILVADLERIVRL
ncbi:MAG: cyclic-di-AMP receptor [Chloroflexota bacterium]